MYKDMRLCQDEAEDRGLEVLATRVSWAHWYLLGGRCIDASVRAYEDVMGAHSILTCGYSFSLYERMYPAMPGLNTKLTWHYMRRGQSMHRINVHVNRCITCAVHVRHAVDTTKLQASSLT